MPRGEGCLEYLADHLSEDLTVEEQAISRLKEQLAQRQTTRDRLLALQRATQQPKEG